MDEQIKELQHTINRLSLENDSNTPDFILAAYLYDCLQAFNRASTRREQWYGVTNEPGGDRSALIGDDNEQ